MKSKHQSPLDLVDLFRRPERVPSPLTRCCGRVASISNENSLLERSGSRESIPLSAVGWNRENSWQARPTSMVCSEDNERTNDRSRLQPSSQRSSTYHPSSRASSYAPECRPSPCASSGRERVVEEDHWCPRCGAEMREPRLLPCLHPICTPCVRELTCRDPRESSREKCSICDFPLPNARSSIPPPHYPLQHRLVIDAVRRRPVNRLVCCDTCSEEVQACVHCSTCLRNFCADCGAEHRTRSVDTRGARLPVHDVRPLCEAREVRRTALCLAHPSHALRFHCIACKKVACRECMWRGAHRGHASESAADAGRRYAASLTAALQKSRSLLNSLLTGYDDRLFADGSLERLHSRSAHSECDKSPDACVFHARSRSTISTHEKEARERIKEFSRLQRARYLLDAVSLGEELLADGSDVEVLGLSKLILRRLRMLGVPLQREQRTSGTDRREDGFGTASKSSHTGVYHCCSFCSSGGRKEATCACGGTMPGRYMGCGHGHAGHPGVDHWSCCGSTHRYGYCLMPRKCAYQIIL